MDYQVVAVTLRDGRVIPDVAIVHCSIVGEVRGYSAIPFDPADITHIEVTHRKSDFQRERIGKNPAAHATTIHVPLVDEGTHVWRPASAEHIKDDVYCIVGEQPADEKWQFAPGQLVRCRQQKLSGGTVVVAYEAAVT